MKHAECNKWGKHMNVNKDKEVIRQPNNIRYLNGRLNEILGKHKQVHLGGKKIDSDILLQHSKKNLGSSNCVIRRKYSDWNLTLSAH